VSPYTHELAALLFQLYGFRNRSGSLAIFTAIRRASSRHDHHRHNSQKLLQRQALFNAATDQAAGSGGRA